MTCFCWRACPIARDTLGGAVAVAQELPDRLGAALLEVAHAAFIDGMRVTSAIAAGMAVGVAVMAVLMLRSHDVPPSEAEAEADPHEAASENVAHTAPTRLEGATD